MINFKKTANQEKIIKGLEKSYEKLLESKRKTNGELVILKDNKVVRIKP